MEINDTRKEVVRLPSMWKLIRQELWKDKFALACLLILLGITIAAFIVGNMVDEDYASRLHILRRDLPPGGGNGILGTDNGGRDMLRILLLSTRNSLAIAFVVAPVTLTIGFTVGLLIGYYGGYVDLVVLRIIDFFVMVPTIMVIIVMSIVLPAWDTRAFILTMIGVGWFAGARLLRARVLQESAKDYVSASKTLGSTNTAIIFKKVLPNVASIMVVQVIFGLAGSIGMETGLTVIGYGLQFGVHSIGRLVALALNPVVLQDRPWQWVPAVTVVVTVTICLYGVGNAVSRAINPRQRRQ